MKKENLSFASIALALANDYTFDNPSEKDRKHY